MVAISLPERDGGVEERARAVPKWQISQKGKDILRPISFIDPNGPSLVPSAVNWATTMSPASMYWGLIMRPSEKALAHPSVHALNF